MSQGNRNRGWIGRLPLIRRIKRAPVVAVVRLDGTIGGGGALRKGLSLDALTESLDTAFRMPGLTAVALAVNSPGGSPVQSALIARRIRDLAAEKDVKVHAFCEDVAASGGYWLACAGDDIHAMPSSIVGSIGVISAGFGFQDLIRRYGVERRVHTSGEKKMTLDPFQPEDPDDAARLERLQREVHDDFIAMVKERRGARLTGVDDEVFSGAFWSGRGAFDLGLVDGLGEMRHTLRGLYGDKVKLRAVTPAKGLLQKLLPRGGGATLGLSATGLGLPVDWAGGLISAAEERALWQRYGL